MSTHIEDEIKQITAHASLTDDPLSIAELLLAGALTILDQDARATLIGAKLADVIDLVIHLRRAGH